ncbi:hypothetical protein GWG65_34350 [Bradyrhizobium sp. CSA207]|uniref:hypothetical protein n=1 Tax=Bradyrhizobium sp. CSA207 TaxID=2698826 RepID=UPI0023AFD1E5|nr:hypothetical protein [Bradyrhizobium sp. CSA207]MDE5446356.1 hypothetical protein [Bradyrhizobium sp. CSA207]
MNNLVREFLGRQSSGSVDLDHAVPAPLETALPLRRQRLDHEASNNDPDHLALPCNHHHRMYDVLFSVTALKVQRAHWQEVKGKRTNAYMKDAGKKAVATRAAKGIGSETARKASATRRANVLKAAQKGQAAGN